MSTPYASFGIKFLDPAALLNFPDSKMDSTLTTDSPLQLETSAVDERLSPNSSKVFKDIFPSKRETKENGANKKLSGLIDVFNTAVEDDFHFPSMGHVNWKRENYLWDTEAMVAHPLPTQLSGNGYSGFNGGSACSQTDDEVADACESLLLGEPRIEIDMPTGKSGVGKKEPNGAQEDLMVSSKYGVRTESQVPAGKLGKVCRVPDCTTLDLSNASNYCVRHRICQQHVKSLRVEFDGVPRRFCQKCTRFHTLDEFDGTKRTCRKGLKSQKRRRLLKNSKGEEEGAAGGGRGSTLAEETLPLLDMKEESSTKPASPPTLAYLPNGIPTSSYSLNNPDLSVSLPLPTAPVVSAPGSTSSAGAHSVPIPAPKSTSAVAPPTSNPTSVPVLVPPNSTTVAAPPFASSSSEDEGRLNLEKQVTELAAALRQVQGQLAARSPSPPHENSSPWRHSPTENGHGAYGGTNCLEIGNVYDPAGAAAQAETHAQMLEASARRARAEAQVKAAQAEAAEAQARLQAELLSLARTQAELASLSNNCTKARPSSSSTPASSLNIFDFSDMTSLENTLVASDVDAEAIQRDTAMVDETDPKTTSFDDLVENLVADTHVPTMEPSSFDTAKQLLNRSQEIASQGPVLTADSKVGIVGVLLKFLDASPETLPANLSEGLKKWLATQASWASSDIRPGCVELSVEYVVDRERIETLAANGVKGLARSLVESPLREFLESSEVRVKAFREWLPLASWKPELTPRHVPEKTESFELIRVEPTCLCTAQASTFTVYGRFPVGTEVIVRGMAAEAFPVTVQGPETVSHGSKVWGPNMMIVSIPSSRKSQVLFVEVRHKGVETGSTVYISHDRDLSSELQSAEKLLVARAERSGSEVWKADGARFTHMCLLTGVALSWKSEKQLDSKILHPAMQFAASNGFVEITKRLLAVANASKASSEEYLKHTNSPLLDAIRYNKAETAAVLLSSKLTEFVGCPISVESLSGLAPLQLAALNPAASDIWNLLTDTSAGAFEALAAGKFMTQLTGADLFNAKKFLAFVRLKLKAAIHLVQYCAEEKVEAGFRDRQLILEQIVDDLYITVHHKDCKKLSSGVVRLALDFAQVALTDLGQSSLKGGSVLELLGLDEEIYQDFEESNQNEQQFVEGTFSCAGCCFNTEEESEEEEDVLMFFQVFARVLGLGAAESPLVVAEPKEERLERYRNRYMKSLPRGRRCSLLNYAVSRVLSAYSFPMRLDV